MSITINIYVMDIDAETGHIFREWDGTKTQLDARLAEGRKVTLGLADYGQDHHVVLERVFSLANGFPNEDDAEATEAYYAARVHSLSVGDLVEIEGVGIFACQNAGFVLCTTAGLPVERNLDGDDATRPTEHIDLPADAPVTCACGDCEREHAAIVAEDRAQSREWDRAEDERYGD